MIAKLFAAPAMKIAAGLQILSLGFIVFLLLAKAAETRRADKLQVALTKEAAAHELTVKEVEKKTAEAKAHDLEHARQVEQAQAQVSQEISHEYQQKLADLRARYDRLRAGTAAADSSGGGREDLPSVPDTASGFDATASDYAFRCEADAIQLMSLQEWIRGQVGVER